ncbi:hypothetical protein [Paenibacillus sp. MER 99-2]|uniref:hypothetical protein n=1 Tax=Paenibacillus sp. MER 99-2 TaxID=2939572 RepID=UPI002040E44D|nr:hypothetical protein [Paenibacillus sp. MER 99-2]MCM3172967.1 hypothetical protein [Paenibacillus sp. MER 99-2]
MTSLTFYAIPVIVFLFFMLVDISNFKWVHLNLRRPSRRFLKGLSFTPEYKLSDVNSDFFRYYREYNLESLQDLEKEITLKSPRYVENNQMTNYILSLVTIFGLTIAAYATISNSLKFDQNVVVTATTSIIVIGLAAYFMAELAIKTFNVNLMDRHLIVIRIVIKEKEKELQLEESRKREREKLRQLRLQKGKKISNFR